MSADELTIGPSSDTAAESHGLASLMVRLRLSQPYFAGLTGRGVRVAVLDSGIQAPHPHVPSVAAGCSIVIDASEEDGLRVVDGEFADRIGHGTAVAGAIHEKAPDAELLAVKVFQGRLSTSAPVLARAIELAVERGANLVNLSLGTENSTHRQLLDDAVRKATAEGVLLVAALDSNGEPSYPGSLAGVVSVRSDASLTRDEVRLLPDEDRVVFAAAPYPRPIPGVPRERNLFGGSFAVANVTGFLARLLEKERIGSPAALASRLRAIQP